MSEELEVNPILKGPPPQGVSSAMAMRSKRQTPEEAITEGRDWALALMRIVKDAGIAVQVEGKQYLKVEAWQTLARFNRCWIDTEWTKDIKDPEGRVIGVEARARLVSIDTGDPLGGAEAACLLEETLTKRSGEEGS